MPHLVELARDAEQAFNANVPPTVWGPKAWALLHATVEDLPCPTCRNEGILMMEAMHDIVNVHKGERPERPKSLCIVAQQAAAATLKSGAVCHILSVQARERPTNPRGIACDTLRGGHRA